MPRRIARTLLTAAGLCAGLASMLGCTPTAGPLTGQVGEQTATPSQSGDSGGLQQSESGLIPIAEAGAVLHYTNAGETFVLDGTRSQDDAIVRDYNWRQVSGPHVFTTREGSLLEFKPLADGTYVFELIATDDQGFAVVVGREAVVVQGAPAASAGGPGVAEPGRTPLTCAMTVLPVGEEFDAATFDHGNNVNWDFCGGGRLRTGVDGDGVQEILGAAQRKSGTLAGEVDYGLQHNFSVEIDGLTSGGGNGGGVTGVYSEKLSFAAPQGQGSAQGDVSGPGGPYYGSITIRLHAKVEDQLVYETYYKSSIGPSGPSSGSIVYFDREGKESIRVALEECTPTAYRMYVVDGVVSEPSEEITISCSISGVRGMGVEAELYRWLHEALQGRATPRTVVAWEVLPDGSVGRTFIYRGAFPKEWTLPSMDDASGLGDTLYHENGGSNTNWLFGGESRTNLVEEITFVAEILEMA